MIHKAFTYKDGSQNLKGKPVNQRVLCEVCHRPSSETICSRRCQSLRKLKAKLNINAIRPCLLDELNQLSKEASICPGRLSKMVLDRQGIVLPEERDALSLLREILFTMREEDLLRFYQKNVLIPKGKGPMDIRGPFRVKAKA
jgi:hypothetical protein